jgi:hypothetical protein
VDEIMTEDLLRAIDRRFRLFQQRALTAEELVDVVLGDLAYQNRYDLVQPITRRLLREVPQAAVAGFVEWDDQRPTSPHRLMVYADSRSVYNHFDVSSPGQWEELQTPDGQARVEAYREELRGNVRRVAATVRTVLEDYQRATDEPVT